MIQSEPGTRDGLIKSCEALECMRKAGAELARIRDQLVEMIAPGVTTLELDSATRDMIEAIGAKPAFLGYHGFPATVCASINEEVVHGIPSADRRLLEGDLLSLDVGLIHYGFYSDTAATVPVGEVAPEIGRLIDVTRRSLGQLSTTPPPA